MSMLARVDRREERLDLVVAERPEDPGWRSPARRWRLRGSTADRTRGTRSRRWRPRAVNPGAKPDDFSRMTVQRSAAGGGPRLGPRSDLVHRQRARADAVGEPARVGHLVDRVDVLRARVRRLAPAVTNRLIRTGRTAGRCPTARALDASWGSGSRRWGRRRRTAAPASPTAATAERARHRQRRRASERAHGSRELRTTPSTRTPARALRCSSRARCAAAWRAGRGGGSPGRSPSSGRRSREVAGAAR